MVDLITKMATKGQMGGERLHRGGAGQSGDLHPRWDRAGWREFHHAAQNSTPLKSCELFLELLFFLLMFLGHRRPQVTEAEDKGALPRWLSWVLLVGFFLFLET